MPGPAEAAPQPFAPPLAAGAGPTLTPPPPNLGPAPIVTPVLVTPPPPGPELVPLITPADLGPVITPPPPDLRAPLVTPPPPELRPAPFITPPPPALGPPVIAPPPPDVEPVVNLGDFETPTLTQRRSGLDDIVFGEAQAQAQPPPQPQPATPPSLQRMPSSPGLQTSPSSPSLAPDADPTEAPREPRISQQMGRVSSAQAVMEHKSMLRRAQERMKGQTHFQVLEIKKDATLDQVRDAYFRLAKIYHPDRCAALQLFDMQPVAEEIFRRINEAHSILTDPEGRKAYEQELDGGGSKKEAMHAMEAEFSFQKGVIFFRKKNFGEALRCFQEAWKLNEKEGEHLAWVAWTQFNDPRTDKGKMLPQIKEQLLRSIKIAPQNAICHYYLGEVYLALGDDKRARTCFTRTVEIQEGHVEANRHLRLMAMRKEKQEKKDGGLFGGLLKKKK